MATKHHKLAKAKQIFENTLDLDARNNLSLNSTASLPVVPILTADTSAVESGDDQNAKKRKNDAVADEAEADSSYIVVSSGADSAAAKKAKTATSTKVKAPKAATSTKPRAVRASRNILGDELGGGALLPESAPLPEYTGHGGDSSSDDEDDMDAFLAQNHGAVPAATSGNGSSSASAGGDEPKPSILKPITPRERHSMGSKFHYWTEEMDALVQEGYALYGNQWRKIAAFVGHGKTDRHCFKRWKNYVNPETACHRVQYWTPEEDAKLMTLCAENTMGKSPMRDKIDWTPVSMGLMRMPPECKHRWKFLTFLAGTLTTPFDEEEDAQIRMTVKSWGANCRGRWVSLATTMNRDPKALLNRWVELSTDAFGVVNAEGASAAAHGVTEDTPHFETTAARAPSSDSEDDRRAPVEVAPEFKTGYKRKPRDFFSEEARRENSLTRFAWSGPTDDLLRQAYDVHGNAWKKVAEFVGHGVTNVQCQKRWTRTCDPEMQNRLNAPWTDEEIAKLRALVAVHTVEHTIGRGKGTTSINWSALSREMNRHYKHCLVKWKSLQIAEMRKGRFAPDEDAVIIARVAEWGNRGQGLWAALEKELNRNAAAILTRWNLTLSKRVLAAK